ncbi:MAG: hypothetical protein KDI17_04020 [Halioglobus sp.]|nr:hypothetical protein [Halioglobus sp.]
MRRASRHYVLIALAALAVVATVRAEVRDIMDQLREQVFVLKPLIASESSFKDPANAPEISEALQNMVALSQQVNHDARISRTGFQVSAAILTQQLQEVETVFDMGNKAYALVSLKSTLGVCMSCHTQLPATSAHFNAANQGHALADPFQEAEFLFLIRDFDAAMKLYAETLQGYPRNQVTPQNLEVALYREIYYYVRVARDMEGLSATLKQNSENQALPQRLQSQVKAFIAAVDSVKNEAYRQFTEAQGAELRDYAKAQLEGEVSGDFTLDSPEKMIAALQLSSVLYEYLDDNPQTQLKPEIFYWLSFGERRYLYPSVHSLPGLYLKQCVLDYPQHPVAKQCFAEYEDIIVVSFTGSGGTNIPDDLIEELAMMRSLVGGR